MGKFRLKSKSSPDSEQLLTPKKSGIFGKQNQGVRSEDVNEKPKKLTSRLSEVFKQNKREEPIDLFDDETAPPTPEFDVLVLTTQRSYPHSPERHVEENCALIGDSSPLRNKTSHLESNDGETVLSELTGTMNKASSSHFSNNDTVYTNLYSKEIGGFDAEVEQTCRGTLVERMFVVVDDACGGKKANSYDGDQQIHRKETELSEWAAMSNAKEDETLSANVNDKSTVDGGDVRDVRRRYVEEEELHDNFELVLSPTHNESSPANPPQHHGIDRTSNEIPFAEEEKKEEEVLSNEELKSQVYESVFGVDHVALAEEERKKAYIRAQKKVNSDADKSKKTRMPGFVKRLKQNMGLSRKGSDVTPKSSKPAKKNETPTSDGRDSDSLIVKGDATRDIIQEAEESPGEGTHSQNQKTKEETHQTVHLQEADDQVMENKNENAQGGIDDIRRVYSGPMSSPDDEQNMESLAEPISLARLRSAPTMLASPKKKVKPVWKSAKDEKTGAVYYYHRLTRQTTWTRPDDSELYDAVQEEAARKATNESDMNAKKKSDESLRKKTERDFDPTVWETKQEIMKILKKFPLPKETNLDSLFDQYAGREDQLLAQFKELVESRPFDEPYQAVSPELSLVSQSSVSIRSSDLGAGTPLKNRVRTAVSATTRVSEKTGATETTEKIRNTSNHQGVMSTTRQKNRSVSTGSISSAADLTPETSAQFRSITPARIPSKIPAVPRERSLQVEVFNQDGHAKAETYSDKRKIIGQDIEESEEEGDEIMGKMEKKPDFAVDYDSYNADFEETIDERGTETASEKATDSISALSDLDGEFSVSKESLEKAKRRALTAAVEREDWDLATALSEGMKQVKSSLQLHESREWAQSDLDRFISENDWDAVSRHIAKMRDQFMPTEKMVIPKSSLGTSSEETTPGKLLPSADAEETEGNDKLVAAPRSKFGARSQLQHSELHSISSWDRSSSSYDSTSTEASRSYDSDEDPGYVTLRVRRDNFEC